MLEQRNVKLDLLALALLALTLFLAIALLTYDPADPPSTVAYPVNLRVNNGAGRLGALSAWLLFESLGVGAYYLLLSLGALDVRLLSHEPIRDRWLRVSGWLISLAGITTLFTMSAPQFSPGPVIGSGGYLGATLAGLLEINVASAGAYLLAISFTVGGLLLSTDYVLLTISAWLFGAPLVAVSKQIVARGNARGAAKTNSDLDQLVTLDEPGAVKLRIGGKQVEVDDATADDEEEEEADEAVAIEPPKVNKPTVNAAPPLLTAAVNAIAGAAASKPQESKPDDAKSADSDQVRVKKRTKKDERNELMQQFDAAAKLTDDADDYELPPIDLLLESEPMQTEEQEKEVLKKAKILEKTFLNFGFNVKVVEIETGPVIAQYEVELEAGLRLSKITGLAEDLAIALRVPSVRIVAPIPGKNTVGIEVPNAERQVVRLREVIEESNSKVQKMRIPIYLGKDVAGNPLVVDLASLPHLLIAGRTGTGKSVCLNTLIASMLMTRRPDEVRMLLIDPKMVELSAYKTLPHLMHPVVTDMRKAEAILGWAVEKMEERYALLARAGVRHIAAFNQLGEEELMERLQPESDEERKAIPTHLPYIVIVADEIADLMMTAPKEVETHIIRLAQKSRAVGIHLVLATQKPTVDVITGLIKSNLPARICFQVASRTDSRVVLDEMGADKLLGNGDLLFLWPGTSMLLRGQGTYVSDDEINKVVEFVGTTEQQFVEELVQLKAAAPGEGDADRFKSRDELYEAAIDLVVREGRGSVSLLQRALGIGYGRAARLVDFMAEDGFVGTYNGSQAREVLISVEQWEQMQGGASGGVSAGSDKPPRHVKVTPERESGGKSASRKKALPPPDYDEDETDEYADAPFDSDDEAHDDEDSAIDVNATDDDSDPFAESDEEHDYGDDELEAEDDTDEEEPRRRPGRRAV